MDWMQTFTIMGTTVGSMYVFYTMIEKHIKKHDEDIREVRQEIFKKDALWSDLLKEIHAIKLGIYTGNQSKGL